MKKARQEFAVMMVKRIKPNQEAVTVVAPIFPIPEFMKSFERKPPDYKQK